LKKHGFSAAPLHGDLDQSVRTRTLDAFRSGEIGLLVASDVAARGLDIPSVSHIFNFDVPFQPDDYVHRIGRTGRAGRTGHALMLVGRRDEKNVAAIEKLIGQPIARTVMEGLPAEEPRTEHTRSRPRAGGERGRRVGRGEARANGHASQPAAEPVTMPVPAMADASALPTKSAPRPQPAPRRQAREPQAPRNGNGNGNGNVSGREGHVSESKPRDLSHLPAFILRPVRLPQKAVKTPERQD
jgi:superfamily II DNA/RNA helicase